MKTHSLNTARFQELLSRGPQSLNRNSEIRKILKSDSFDRRLSLCICEVVRCQVCLWAPTSKKRLFSPLIFFLLFCDFGKEMKHFLPLFISLSVNNDRLRCGNINVFDYGGLPKTPLGMLHNIRYIHGITFLKPEKIPEQL
jgi:hypothetical protein